MKSFSKFLVLLLILTLSISSCVSEKNTSKTEESETSTAVSVANESDDNSSTGTEYSYAVYKAAVDKTNLLKAVEGSIKEQFDIEMSSIIMPVSVEASFKIDHDKKEGIVQRTTGAAGTTMNTLIYIAEGYSYTDFEGTKTKEEAVFDDVADVNIQAEVFAQSAVKSSVEYNVDGIKYHKITVVGKEFFASSMSESIKDQLGSFHTEVDYDKVEIGEVDILFLYKDGYIVKTKIKAEVSYSDGESDIKIEYSSEKALNNPGDPVEIEAPDDLDQYVEAEF